MQVILFRSVDNLGSAGEIVEVKRGYYRNFLGPRGYAKIANKENIALIEGRRKKIEVMLAREREEASTIAEKLTGVELTFSMRANDKGQLFGSVTSMDIAQQLANEGHAVDRRKIELPENLKAVGTYPVRIRVYPEVYAEISVIVQKEVRPEELEDQRIAEEEAAAEQERRSAEDAALDAAEKAYDEQQEVQS
ncbi:MAG: 50S ribosomal protein L9 [Sumerlaeia bacterium]